MPNDDFELQAWLSDISADGSLSQEEVSSLRTILGKEKVTPKLRDHFLMRRDYSRKTQEVADERKKVDADIQILLAERADLAAWHQGIETKLSNAMNDLEKARITEAQYRARIQKIAEQTGLDPKELMGGLPEAVAAAAAAAALPANAHGNGNGAPALDTSKFASSEEFSRFARMSPMLTAELFDLAQEHTELFQKPLKVEYTDARGTKWTGTRALVVMTAENNQRNPQNQRSVRQIWEEQFKVPDRRREIERSQIETELRTKLDAEYKTKLSENVLASGTPGTSLTHAPESRPLFTRDKVVVPGGDGGTPPAGQGANQNEPPVRNGVDDAVGKTTHWLKAAHAFVDRRAQGVPLGGEVLAGAGKL